MEKGYMVIPVRILQKILQIDINCNLSFFQCNFRGALASYERALSVSAQREVRLLCLHEVGWSYVLLLKWDKSSVAFLKLKQQSRWSKSFYTYLSAGERRGPLSKDLLHSQYL